MMENEELYRVMFLIRRFEETVLDNFRKGIFFGTTHVYIGQEANAAGVLAHLHPDDIVVSNHRCHGHFLAYEGEPRALFAELMGKATGVCAGRGGSQHLHWKNFYSNGIQGGIAPLAVGMALAEKIKRSGVIVTLFLGDGTFGEGTLYEALNLVSLWSAPLLIVVEDNHIAQTTPVELGMAGLISGRLKAFDIPTLESDSSDVLEITALAGQAISEVRNKLSPHGLILHTCRFAPHSKGDDTRPASVVERMRQERDPVHIHAPRLAVPVRNEIERQVESEIENAFSLAKDDPFPA
jgi:acetoin:2,6-dichlorophenolindophenol oxidoreductase subunit alpha